MNAGEIQKIQIEGPPKWKLIDAKKPEACLSLLVYMVFFI